MKINSELSVDEILRAASTVAEVMGRKWITKRLRQEEQHILLLQRRATDRKYGYTYRHPPHPLIRPFADFERMRNFAGETGNLNFDQGAMTVILLGQSLSAVRHLPGFEKFVPRLRGEESFYPAVFEIETAANYVHAGYRVSFVPENPKEKTPDIKVTQSSGEVFWVECKCREGLNARDQKIAEFWIKLEQQLLGFFGPQKIAATVIVKALRDPVVAQDMNPLLSQIFASVEAGGLGELMLSTGLRSPVKVLDGQFELIVQLLAAPDQELRGNGLELLGGRRDRITMSMEHKLDEFGKSWIRNPIILGFQNHRPMDKVKGLVAVLRSAAAQLPKTGPGVVYIRVPDNFWADDFLRYEDEVIREFNGELSGENNRRVNLVVIKSMMYQNLRDGEKIGLGLKPVSVLLRHKNPYLATNGLDGAT